MHLTHHQPLATTSHRLAIQSLLFWIIQRPRSRPLVFLIVVNLPEHLRLPHWTAIQASVSERLQLVCGPASKPMCQRT